MTATKDMSSEKNIEEELKKEDCKAEVEKEEADQKNNKNDNKDYKQNLEEENSSFKDKYMRLYAEFDNYRRRTTKEKTEYISMASKNVIYSLLPVIDDFERALKTLNQEDPKIEGIKLIVNKLKNLLEQQGLKEIEIEGRDFNADLHEAVTSVPSEEMKGKIIEVIEKGYMLNDKVIRFAKVVVGG